MSEIRVASRYAKSLIDLAEERGVLEQVKNDMELFTQTVEKSIELRLLLRNPIVKSDKKQVILNKLFAAHMNEMTIAFFGIIARKNREAQLETVAKQFIAQYNQKKGIQVAQVTTAAPLDSGLRDELKQLVISQTGKKVVLEEKVNPSLIGGFVLRIGDRQIDSSIQNSIRRLRNKFKENPYITKL